MDWCATPDGLRAKHPVIAAFAELKYDAITLGNHEFDYGMTALSPRIGEATQPVVSCNIAGVDHVVPWTILKRDVPLPANIRPAAFQSETHPQLTTLEMMF